MVIVVYSETNSALIEKNLGEPEYSYYFVLKAFIPILEQIGRVVVVSDWSEVDAIYRSATMAGEECVFLSFSPPHRTPLDLACPTIPVFAWEFDTIPNETWFGERGQDWRYVLNKFGRGITHSSFSVDAVRSAMGPDFPIVSIPAPVFDRLKTLRGQPHPTTTRLVISGKVIDTRAIDLEAYSPARLRAASAPFPHEKPDWPTSTQLDLDGVVYMAVINPYAARKNSFDMLCGFCWALRERDDATLVLKLAHNDLDDGITAVMENVHKLGPIKCRVVLIGSYLSDEDYAKLLMASTYTVNTSQGEGQCLPLMESMSIGKPAVAPRHTGMIDYLSADNAFLVETTLEPANWPHDPRGAYRAVRHRIDFESLLRAFENSYRVAKEQPERYTTMARAAEHALDRHCSDAATLQRLRQFLATAPRKPVANPDYGKLKPPLDTYALGSTVDFGQRFDARKYLRSGWAGTELGLGVWSHGPLAELSIRVARRQTHPLLLRLQLTGFVVPEHPDLTVRVSANDCDIAQWTFSVAQPDKVHGSWHEAVIPAEVAWDRAVCIKLAILHPASPRKLGVSIDTRSLGVMLHKLSIAPMT